jgi:sulfofructose kinase
VSQSFDILGLGAVAVDDLLYVEGYPSPDEKIRVLRRERQAGGQTGTALVAAARAGAKCAYAGRLSQDELGLYIADTFLREGIDCSAAPATASAQVAHSTIIVDVTTGSRTILSSVSDEGLGPPPEGPPEALIQDAKVLLIDHHGVEGTLHAAKHAQRLEIPVVADFERLILGDDSALNAHTVAKGRTPFQSRVGIKKSSSFEELLATHVDHLIVDRPFAEAAAGGTQNIKDLFASLWNAERKVVCITLGSEGYCFQKTEIGANDEIRPGVIEHRPAFSVDAIDTTGCGDVFHGVYAAMLAEGRPLEKRLSTASASAAINATQHGGQAGIPDLAAIAQFLRRNEAR